MPPPRTTRPTARPPLALRSLVGVAALAAALASIAILISDRAPRVLRAVFGDAVVRVSDRLDASNRADAALGDRVPGNDAIVHISIWAVVTVLAGLAIWTWWGVIVVAAGALVASGVVELAQGRYSETRAVERADVLANAVGVTAGAVLCVVCFLAWSGAAGVFASRTTR